MRDLKCLRCNAQMTFVKREKLQLGKTGIFFGDWSNIIAGALDTEIYCCSKCGKLEFFFPEDSADYFEEPEDLEGEYLPPDMDQNIVGVSAEGVPQVQCPSCGRKHDFDYPKCVYCEFDYYA